MIVTIATRSRGHRSITHCIVSSPTPATTTLHLSLEEAPQALLEVLLAGSRTLQGEEV